MDITKMLFNAIFEIKKTPEGSETCPNCKRNSYKDEVDDLRPHHREKYTLQGECQECGATIYFRPRVH